MNEISEGGISFKLQILLDAIQRIKLQINENEALSPISR